MPTMPAKLHLAFRSTSSKGAYETNSIGVAPPMGLKSSIASDGQSKVLSPQEVQMN